MTHRVRIYLLKVVLHVNAHYIIREMEKASNSESYLVVTDFLDYDKTLICDAGLL